MQVTVPTGTMSDEQLAQLLQQYFSMQPSAFLAAAQQPPNISKSSKPTKGSSRSGKAAPAVQGNSTRQYESVDSFVSEMSKLLELEKQAEVAAAQEATSLCSTEAAQVGQDCAPLVVGFFVCSKYHTQSDSKQYCWQVSLGGCTRGTAPMLMVPVYRLEAGPS